MREKIKEILKFAIYGIIIFSGSTYAAKSYYANEIVYANQAGIDVTVGEALDDLYYASSNFANPRGTIISVMRTNAPEGYLKCDGTIYNISDYQKLADLFNEEFGKTNYFGGDGETTFAVPDLRGEFLRGTGTNSHANQGSGSSVGIHQNATKIPNFGINHTGTDSSSGYSLFGRSSTSSSASDINSIEQTDYSSIDTNSKKIIVKQSSINVIANGTVNYTTRPTNTSVLYCIKY